MSRSSLSRAFSRRSRMTSSSAATGCPDPGNAWPPAASSCAAHLYSRLRGTPNSRANSAAGRPDCFSNRTASSLNSLVNRWRWPIVHLPGHCVPVRGVRQTRASSGTIRKWSQSPRWSVAGGDDLAAQEGAGADGLAGELRRRLAVLVVVHPLLSQVSVELLLLLVSPVPVRRQLLKARHPDRGERGGL